MNEDSIFAAALEKSPEQRNAFLDGACADQPELRSNVEALLKAHERAGRFLAPSAAEEATACQAPLWKRQHQTDRWTKNGAGVRAIHSPPERKRGARAPILGNLRFSTETPQLISDARLLGPPLRGLRAGGCSRSQGCATLKCRSTPG